MEIAIDEQTGNRSPEEDDASGILFLDPDNGLGFGKTLEKVLESLKSHSKNGVHHFVIRDGGFVPAATIQQSL